MGKKVPTAFFRGNLTGGGIDKETNQRINLITLAHECEGKKNTMVEKMDIHI